jgi:hypothetical protein
MTLVNEGMLALLGALVNGVNPTMKIGGIKVISGGAVVAGSVIGDITESTFSGYAEITPSGYSAPTVNGSSEGETDSPALAFTADSGISGAEHVIGVFTKIKDGSGTYKLFTAELFASPVTVALNGDTVPFTLNLFDKGFTP